MNITFIKDCPPLLISGWSAYKEGDQATLRGAVQLIDAGYAREGWGSPPVDVAPTFTAWEFDEYGINALRETAKKAGIKHTSRMKRETLIKRLRDGDS